MTNNIDPNPEQFAQFKSLPRDTEIMMLNLIELKQTANYDDQNLIVSGAEAYKRYGEESGPIFSRVGGEILWRGKPECVLIGPESEHWDIAFIAKYPNAGAFLEMVTDPAYQAIVFHRQAAVKDNRLIRMGVSATGDAFSA